jgi:hypothetical protein
MARRAPDGHRRPGSAKLRTLLNRHDLGRTDSGWEVRTAQLLVAAGFAPPIRQHPIHINGKEIARADLAYPDARVAIEYDSDAWYTGTARRHRDAHRRNRLRALGGPSSRSRPQPCATPRPSSPI